MSTRRHYHPGALEKTMNGNKIVYGIINVAAFNTRSSGDQSWYATSEERDEALESMRGRAVARGLSESAARSGIYAVRARWSEVRTRRGVGIRMTDDLVSAAA